MTIPVRVVTVKQVPESFSKNSGRLFFHDLKSCMNVDRPSFVFDCSKVLHMDRATVQLLLCCLEEVILRNGDVKLAAISEQARKSLKQNGADSLFKIFDTSAEAANSFRQLSAPVTLNAFAPEIEQVSAENAAQPSLNNYSLKLSD